MKKIILMATMLLTLGFVKAQIAEVKEDGSYLKIYDDSGYKTSISKCSRCLLAGYNNNYVVIVDGSYIKIYNSSGNYKTSISKCSSCSVKNVSGSYILINDGSYTKYYDFKGSYIKSTSN